MYTYSSFPQIVYATVQIDVIAELCGYICRHVRVVEKRIRVMGGAFLRFLFDVVIWQVGVRGGDVLPEVPRYCFESVII